MFNIVNNEKISLNWTELLEEMNYYERIVDIFNVMSLPLEYHLTLKQRDFIVSLLQIRNLGRRDLFNLDYLELYKSRNGLPLHSGL